jgi:uncharacterized membrane protein
MVLKIIERILLIIMLILSGFVSSTGTRAQNGVLLVCESNEHYTVMEQFIDYQIQITNIGDEEDTYTLTKEAPIEHWQTQLSIQIITIPTEESRNIILKVKPTCECESGIKAYVNVTATSQNDETISDTVQTITTYASVKVSLWTNTNYKQIEKGESCIYEINARNEGSENDTFQLSVNQIPELDVELSDKYLMLPSKSNGTINLTVKSSQSIAYGYYALNIKAVSIHNSEKSDELLITIIVGKIDFTIHNISLSNKHPGDGESITVTLELMNSGTVNVSDLMITFYYLTKEDSNLEIDSELVSIETGEKIIREKNIVIHSNFTGILIEAKIAGKYEIWQESITKEELGLKLKETDNAQHYQPYLILGILIILLILIIRKKNRVGG